MSLDETEEHGSELKEQAETSVGQVEGRPTVEQWYDIHLDDEWGELEGA